MSLVDRLTHGRNTGGLREAGRGHTDVVNAPALMPKVGRFKGLAFNNPTPQTEDLYIDELGVLLDR